MDEKLNIVLASGSPRRKELLKMIGIEDFKVIVDNTDEDVREGLSPEETVCEIALKKAKNVSKLCGRDDIIIAADTLVYLDNEAISKPVDEADAVVMLKKLSGRKHTVFTGIVLIQGDRWSIDSELTDVYFREITDEEISAYVKTGEPMDKAGAYAAQGKAAIFVERIDGDFFNVMGLPLCKLYKMLTEFCKFPITII